MKELGDHTLCDTVSATYAKVHALVLVLMKYQNVEPLIFVFQRPLKFDPFVLESHIESFVLHVADAVQCNLGGSLPEQDWNDFYVLDVGDFAKVVDVVVAGHQIDV